MTPAYLRLRPSPTRYKFYLIQFASTIYKTKGTFVEPKEHSSNQRNIRRPKRTFVVRSDNPESKFLGLVAGWPKQKAGGRMLPPARPDFVGEVRPQCDTFSTAFARGNSKEHIVHTYINLRFLFAPC